MTDAFDQLKTAANSQLAKQEGWVRANRKGLIVGAAAMLVLWIVAHHFGIG